MSCLADMAASNSMEDYDAIDSPLNTEQQQGINQSHSFFAAQHHERFWVASIILAVILHKLFLH